MLAAWAITFSDRSICFQEVWLKVDLKQISCDPLYCVVDWQHMDAFAVLHIWARLDAEMQADW